MPSRAAIEETLKAGPVTHGWGAVSVYSRDRLNRLLEQLYIEQYATFNSLPSFMGSAYPSDDPTEDVGLYDIQLGAPLLSFETASLSNSRATLTLNIVSGRMFSRHSTGSLTRFTGERRVFEEDGYKVSMDIDLAMVIGEVDRFGKVTVNLSKAVNFRCDLLGADEALQAQLGKRFQAYFAGLPGNSSTLVLGMLNVLGADGLTPLSFRIFTQAAPGSKLKNAANAGDGVVLVFIRYRANEEEGENPTQATFPYLMPNDQVAGGGDMYSAVTVLSSAMYEYLVNGLTDVMDNLLFPGQHTFVLAGTADSPYGSAMFGNISPAQTRLSISPSFLTLKTGATHKFALRDINDKEVPAKAWRVRGVGSHNVYAIKSGTVYEEIQRQGTVVDGLYTAPSQANIGADRLRVVVTAEYVEGGVTYTASALLLVLGDGLLLSRRTALHTARSLEPINLSVLATGAVEWKALEPAYGTLQASVGKAVFTPNAASRTSSLAVQQIEATQADKTAVKSALVLVNAQQLVGVSPALRTALPSDATVDLSDANPALLPGLPRRWKVISGEGTVDANGRFTPPTQRSTASSVVQCTVARNGIVFGSGYSVIEMSSVPLELKWVDLEKFDVQVNTSTGSGQQAEVFNNGYQQVEVIITLETKKVDDIYVYPSQNEIESMRLVDQFGMQLPVLPETVEGIEADDLQRWQTRVNPNLFTRLGIPQRKTAADSQPLVDGDVPIAKFRFYLHCRDASANNFFALIQQDPYPPVNGEDEVAGRVFRTTDKGGVAEKIYVAPKLFRPPLESDYEFERIRTVPNHVGEPNDDEQDFDFQLVTEDYWKFQYKPAHFVTREFMPSEGAIGAPGNANNINTSIIMWESDYATEKMFSWTGSVFGTLQDNKFPETVLFDEALSTFMEYTDIHSATKQEGMTIGMMMFILRRTDDVLLLPPHIKERIKLNRNLAIMLRDVDGNAHWRLVLFDGMSKVGKRSKLKTQEYKPPSLPKA